MCGRNSPQKKWNLTNQLRGKNTWKIFQIFFDRTSGCHRKGEIACRLEQSTGAVGGQAHPLALPCDCKSKGKRGVKGCMFRLEASGPSSTVPDVTIDWLDIQWKCMRGRKSLWLICLNICRFRWFTKKPEENRGQFPMHGYRRGQKGGTSVRFRRSWTLRDAGDTREACRGGNTVYPYPTPEVLWPKHRSRGWHFDDRDNYLYEQWSVEKSKFEIETIRKSVIAKKNTSTLLGNFMKIFQLFIAAAKKEPRSLRHVPIEKTSFPHLESQKKFRPLQRNHFPLWKIPLKHFIHRLTVYHPRHITSDLFDCIAGESENNAYGSASKKYLHKAIKSYYTLIWILNGYWREKDTDSWKATDMWGIWWWGEAVGEKGGPWKKTGET